MTNQPTNKTNKITSFNITWTAEHEQYWQGHGTAFTDYTHTATGCGDTLREAFEDAVEELYQEDLLSHGVFNAHDTEHGKACEGCKFEQEMLAELTSQVKEPEMLDLDIMTAECPTHGVHSRTTDDGDLVEDTEPDCSVCAGEWHFYVSIDVEVEEGEAQQ